MAEFKPFPTRISVYPPPHGDSGRFNENDADGRPCSLEGPRRLQAPAPHQPPQPFVEAFWNWLRQLDNGFGGRSGANSEVCTNRPRADRRGKSAGRPEGGFGHKGQLPWLVGRCHVVDRTRLAVWCPGRRGTPQTTVPQDLLDHVPRPSLRSGARGAVDAQRLRWDPPGRRPLQPRPRRATTLKDGFAYVANFSSKSPP